MKTGTLSAPTVAQSQLLLPMPQYTTVNPALGNISNSTYHSLQMKLEKRFPRGGTVLGAYTFSKLLADVASLTGWLDSGVGQAPGLQNPYNIARGKIAVGL